MGVDWVPKKEQDLYDLGLKWNEWAGDAAKRTAFGWDSTACSNAILKIGNFISAREAYQVSDTSENLILKNAARKVMKTMMRAFANSYIRFNTKMNEAEKSYMGVHERDDHNTPQPTPTDHVEFTLTVDAQAHSVRADYRIEGEFGHSKRRYHGVEVRFWVLPLDAAAPVTADDLAWRSEVDTATPWAHTFNQNEVGKRLYITMCWENGSIGKNQIVGKGPWSTVQSVVIA
jgi:hypothetical protein